MLLLRKKEELCALAFATLLIVGMLLLASDKQTTPDDKAKDAAVECAKNASSFLSYLKQLDNKRISSSSIDSSIDIRSPRFYTKHHFADSEKHKA